VIETADAPTRPRRAAMGGLVGAACGAGLGLADILRAMAEGPGVLDASHAPGVVALHAALLALPAALLGAAVAPATAAALVVAGTATLAAGLAANRWLLPAFLDPVSLGADAALLVAGVAGAHLLRRRWIRTGTPAARLAAAVAGAALAVALALAPLGGREDGPTPVARLERPGLPPDIVLVCIDTWRWDAVGWSGEPDPSPTPALDALAATGTIFHGCRAPSSWTKPSTASLLTGLYPTQHGALDFESVLPAAAESLPEILRAAGYRTAAFADNPFLSPEYGFAQGFDAFTGRAVSPLLRGTLLGRAALQALAEAPGHADHSFGPGKDIGAERLVDGALEFLRAAPAAKPSFAYLHLIEPHFPYTPPPPHDGGRPRVDPPPASGILPFDTFEDLPPDRRETLLRNYLGEVRAADDALGRLFAALRDAGRLARTLVVVTSDHGEEFHDHGGWTHGQSLHDELVRVPLLVVPPAGGPGAGRRVDAVVSLVDVAPTILDLAGVATPSRGGTRSLVPWMTGEASGDRPCAAELEAGPVGSRALFAAGKVLLEAWKGGDRRRMLYDTVRDPRQRRDLLAIRGPTGPTMGDGPAGEAEALARAADQLFGALRKEGLARERRAMDPDSRRALEGIGYLGPK
jgi:choline-sulfatase